MKKHLTGFPAGKPVACHATKTKPGSVFYLTYPLLLLCGLFVSLKAAALPATAPTPYNATIYVPVNQSGLSNVMVAAADMAHWLTVATGDSFKVVTSDHPSTNGIQLQWLADANLPASYNTQKNQMMEDGQSFGIIASGTHSALIIGTGENSFINGIYTFMHELGFRWYMPGDAWAKVPPINKTKLKIKKLYRPSFQNRTYFGTGPTAPLPGLDPTNTFKKDFVYWDQRNRFTYDFTTTGHLGQAFYNQNKSVLDANPNYFCSGVVNPKGRIDIGNASAVDLFVNWAVNRVDTTARFQMIGAEPADGSGGTDDCLPTSMPGITTWSDKYFWLANQVAQKAAIKRPNAKVQIYAYASHAATPSFPIHDKIYPIIIPYAFQRETVPGHFVQMWHEKVGGRPMGLYDYWNITQWTLDVPDFDIYSIPEKLNFWRQNNVTTVKLESTEAKGPMGHAFWIAGQMMWDISLSFESLYNEFLTDCFGPAAPDLRNMYDRWSRNYQEDLDWAFSLRDLKVATAKTSDTAILSRLRELKAYVHYLKLFYEYKHQPSDANFQQLIKYTLSIHHLRLLQTYALVAKYITPPAGYTPAQLQSTLGAMTAGAVPISPSEIDANFAADLAASPALYSVSAFQFDIYQAQAIAGITLYHPTSIIGRNTYKFHVPTARTITFQAGANQPTQFLLQDHEEAVLREEIIPASESGYQTISMPVPAGDYYVSFGGLSGKARLKFPEGIPFFTNGRYYSNSQYPLQYVYVPHDVDEIVYVDGEGPGTGGRGNWMAPDGTVRNPSLVKYNIYKVAVAPSERGKVWALNIGHRDYKLLNIPNVYSLNKFQYGE